MTGNTSRIVDVAIGFALGYLIFTEQGKNHIEKLNKAMNVLAMKDKVAAVIPDASEDAAE